MKKFLPLFAFWLLLACESPELTEAVSLDSLVPRPSRMDVPDDSGMTVVQGSVRFVGIPEGDFAELDETALYAGIGRSFQIWLPERYRSREANTRARAKTDGLPSLRLGRGAPRSTTDNGDR